MWCRVALSVGIICGSNAIALAAADVVKPNAAKAPPAALPPAAGAPFTPKVVTPTPAAPTAAQVEAAARAAAAVEAARVRQAAIDAAKTRCTALLKSIQAVAIQREPIEEGECGALAPVELISVGKNPEVALSPPAIVTCELAVAIHDWMKADVQPLARTHLGKPVMRIETMSSYSCRQAYGRKKGNLSEHGRANALDIRGFVSTAGETAYLLNDWGLTSGEIKAASAAAEKLQAERAVAQAAAQAATVAAAEVAARAKIAAQGATTQPTGNPLSNAKTLVDGLPRPKLSIDGLPAKSAPTEFGIAPPNRLGGPKKTTDTARPASPAPYAAAVAAQPGSDAMAAAKSLFLRQVHASACRRFGTTLGPEANAAHRNHFHIDMAERKTKLICD